MADTTTTITVDELFEPASAEELFSAGLELAKRLKLPVTSWREGDTTLTLLQYVAERLEQHELIISDYTKGGYQSTATGDWATLGAKEVYGVGRDEAGYVVSKVTLTNADFGYFEFDGPGAIVFRASSTGKTYRTTNEGTYSLASGIGETLTVDVIADEAGSASSVGVDEIDSIVSPAMANVSVTASDAGAASDGQTDEQLYSTCLSTLGALSPNGPPDAYVFVATNEDLTGASDVTRAEVDYDDPSGDAVVYLASSSGAVLPESVDLVQAALEQYAQPIGFHAIATNSTEVTDDVTVTVSGGVIPGDIGTTGPSAINAIMLATRIGGTLSRSAISAAVQKLCTSDTIVVVVAPATDIVLSPGEVLQPGTVSVSEV